MHWVTRGRSDKIIWKCVQYTGSVVIRPRNDVLPVRGVCNRLDRVSMPPGRLSSCGTSLGIPDSNGAVGGPGDDVPPIGRVCNGQDRVSVPLERMADCSTSLGIPDSNGVVVGSGDDVAPIGRVSNGQH